MFSNIWICNSFYKCYLYYIQMYCVPISTSGRHCVRTQHRAQRSVGLRKLSTKSIDKIQRAFLTATDFIIIGVFLRRFEEILNLLPANVRVLVQQRPSDTIVRRRDAISSTAHDADASTRTQRRTLIVNHTYPSARRAARERPRNASSRKTNDGPPTSKKTVEELSKRTAVAGRVHWTGGTASSRTVSGNARETYERSCSSSVTDGDGCCLLS